MILPEACSEHTIRKNAQADADHEQMDIEVLAGLQAEAIEIAIVKYREARSSEGRVDSALAAVAWTAIFALVSYFFFAKRRIKSRSCHSFSQFDLTNLHMHNESIDLGFWFSRITDEINACNVFPIDTL